MPRAVIGVAAGAVAACLIGACSLLTSFDGIAPREVSPPVDSGGAADTEAAADAGCVLERWPGPPPGTDTGRDLGELVSALTRLRILDPVAEGKQQGFDLDGLCTCPDRPACVGAKPNEPCDSEGGVDNSGDGLFKILASQKVSLDDQGLRTGIEKGQYGLVVRVAGYDGERDDPIVTVAVFNAVAVNGDGGVPREDGTDRWLRDRDSLLGEFPAYFSTSAYVSGGVLVAELLSLTIKARIPTSPTTFSLLQLDLQNVHLVARLGARTASGITLEDGRLAGRLPAPNLLAQGMRSGVCRDSGTYEALKPLVCSVRDLPLDPAQDGRDQPCRSLSVGFGFSSSPALIENGSGTRNDSFPCPVVADDCP
jgi:hypothetical protein